MKESFSKIIGLTARQAIFLSVLTAGVTAEAASLSEARVSQVIQDVKMLPSNAAPRPAAVNDKVTQGTAVRTGVQSRAELTFTDLTITRLGENTVFSLNAGAREIDLAHGSVLVEVPPKSEPAKISTAAVTAAVTGGTALFGTGPPVKFMVLEGIGTFYPLGHPELAVTLHGGEMVMLTADGHITQPQKFDVKAVVETSALIVGFPDLANLPLILQVMDQQQVDQSTASASPPPTKDIIDIISQNTVANPAAIPTPPSGGPPAGGGLATITTPDPYVISSGTTIDTGPLITTGGVTNSGALYLGTAVSGTPTEFLFGQPETAFDLLVFTDPDKNLPVAVFKFADLELAGDPTITVPTGATTNLALVAVGTITSGLPGGTLTFAGITRLDFITQNGSITLGPEISFSGIDHLTFYARGSGSTLTLDSPISGGSVVHLSSEGDTVLDESISATNEFTSLSGGNFTATSSNISANDIGIQTLSGNIAIDGTTLTSETLELIAGNDLDIGPNSPVTINAVTLTLTAANNLNWSGGTLIATATNSDGDVTVSAGQAINITNDLDIEQTNNGQTDGLNITLSAGTVLSVGGNLTLTTDASNLATGGNIVVTSGGDMTIGGDFTLFISAGSGTTTGVGGNINVTSGGSLTAGSLNFDLFFDPSAQVTNGENLTLSVTNNLITTAGDVSLVLSTPVGPARPPLMNGGNVSMTVGGDVTLASGGNLILQMINSGVTNVPVGGNISASIGGNLSANQVNALITNSGDSIIGTGGNLTFSVGGTATASSVTLDIDNSSSSAITTGGNLNFTVGGDANLGDVTLSIENSNGSVISSGGDMTASFGSLTASSVSLTIDNSSGGLINGSATIGIGVGPVAFGPIAGSPAAVILSGNMNITGDATFQIVNNASGEIGGAANISVSTTGDFSANSLTAFINNRDGGFIGSSAQVLLNIGGTLTTQGDATIGISNRNDGAGGGTIFGDTTVNVQAGSVAIGGSLTSFVAANGGEIEGNGTLTFNVAGDITSGTGGTVFQVASDAFNSSGGPVTPGLITGDASLNVTAANFTSSGPILVTIDDNSVPSGGTGVAEIDGNAIMTLQTQNITTTSTDSGVIGTDTMALEASIYTNVNGTVKGDALINVTASQDITAGGTALFWVANGNYLGEGVGNIDGNAEVNVNAVDISTGDFYLLIENFGGSSIGKTASLALQTSTISVGLFQAIINNNGGSIGSDATVLVSTQGPPASPTSASATTGDLTANSMLVQIDDTEGSIAGNATVNMNVAGTATVSGDATVQILGNDPGGSAAINFNGGTYNVTGNFLSTIDGNGTINFNNTNVTANTIKAGVFGSTNATLMIGGGSWSANQLFKLYAGNLVNSGSIEFTANVTLNCAAAAVILAANKITIDDNVVVTIAGGFAATAYANIANYTGSGGNGSTTGMFAGNGATTSPLSSAPPFSDPPSSSTSNKTTSSTNAAGGSSTKGQNSSSTSVASSSSASGASRRGHRSLLTDGLKQSAHSMQSGNSTTAMSNTIKVADSGQLLSLLDSASPGSNGKITIPASKGSSNSHQSGLVNARISSRPDRVAMADTESSAKRTASVERNSLSLR